MTNLDFNLKDIVDALKGLWDSEDPPIYVYVRGDSYLWVPMGAKCSLWAHLTVKGQVQFAWVKHAYSPVKITVHTVFREIHLRPYPPSLDDLIQLLLFGYAPTGIPQMYTSTDIAQMITSNITTKNQFLGWVTKKIYDQREQDLENLVHNLHPRSLGNLQNILSSIAFLGPRVRELEKYKVDPETHKDLWVLQTAGQGVCSLIGRLTGPNKLAQGSIKITKPDEKTYRVDFQGYMVDTTTQEVKSPTAGKEVYPWQLKESFVRPGFKSSISIQAGEIPDYLEKYLDLEEKSPGSKGLWILPNELEMVRDHLYTTYFEDMAEICRKMDRKVSQPAPYILVVTYPEKTSLQRPSA